MASPRKVSHFNGSSSRFPKQEEDIMEETGEIPLMSPKASMKRFGNSSMNNISYSPKTSNSAGGSTHRRSVGRKSGNSKLEAPPFVSPGAGATRQYTSSYLDKPSGTPKARRSKGISNAGGFGKIPFTPSPENGGGKAKVNGKSWKNKISFQAAPASPGVLAKKKVAKPAFTQHYGGSFLDKGYDSPGSLANNKKKAARPSFRQDYGGSFLEKGYDKDTIKQKDPLMETTPDIQIEVKPDLAKKIRERKAAAAKFKKEQIPTQETNIPEWKQKFQEREANRIRKENERIDRAAALLQAYFLGWKARVEYPKLLEANAERLEKIRAKERHKLKRKTSAIQIQKKWRGFLPRKRFLYVQECRRRRQRNEKEIKRMKKRIKQLPKDTKAEIKEMKKENAEKKKGLKKEVKKAMKEDEKRLAAIKKSGKDMIKFLKEENKKLKEKQDAMKTEYKVLEKQFNLLTEKSDEISNNFGSLQRFVDKKNISIQRNEINSQKCRHRYLPKYREMLKERDKHITTEHTIAQLYREKTKDIVRHMTKKCKDKRLVEFVIDELANVEADVGSQPRLEYPEALRERIERSKR